MTIQAAISHLESSGQFRVENKGLVRESLLGELKHFLNSSYHTAEIKKIIALVKDSLKSAPADHKANLLKFADAVIKRYGSDKSVEKVLRTFDAEMRLLRDDQQYRHPANRTLLEKWQTAEQPEEMLHNFPAFAQFLQESKLLPQLKVTRDTLTMLEGEPALLVEGHPMKASELMQKFKIVSSKEYNDTFVVDSKNNVCTYLDNGLGLQKFHPYLTVEGPPLSRVSEQEIGRVRGKAEEFIRPEEASLSQSERRNRNAKRPFVMQVVTSAIDHGNSNLATHLRNARHSYLRLVAGEDLPEHGIKKGDVYEFGFGRKKDPLLPFSAGQGRFRTPDPYEYKECDARYVTNIPVSAEEAGKAVEFTRNFHRGNVEMGRQIGFQVAQQNCTVFVRKALEQANIQVPTQIGLIGLIQRVTPDVIKKLGAQAAAWAKTAFNIAYTVGFYLGAYVVNKYVPDSVTEWAHWSVAKTKMIAKDVLEGFTALILTPIRTFLGGMNGEGGESFDPKEGKIAPPAWGWRNMFDLSSYRYNLPSVLQNWQKEQSSTVVYKDPVRLAIVP